MTFIVKIRGDITRPIVAVYTCPEHGEFDLEVQRDENGEAPDSVPCPIVVPADEPHRYAVFVGDDFVCSSPATWTPSHVACRVRRIEVTRGKWEQPERKTYLDTRKLGEGQDPSEFQAERKKVWNEQRHKRVKDLLR